MLYEVITHISVPTIPALARARRYLDEQGASGRVTLIITGGLRVPADFIKALALGADGIAIANSAIQAIGCIAARICNTNNCPSGIARITSYNVCYTKLLRTLCWTVFKC